MLLFKAKKRNRTLTRELASFKQDTLLFKQSLQPITPLKEDETIPNLKIGSESSTKQLIVVLSFYCGACEKILKDLILLSEMEDVGITLKLTTKNEESKKIIAFLHQLHITRGNQVAITALTKWYEVKDLTNLKLNFPLPNTINKEIEKNLSQFLEASKSWLKNIKLTHTPFIIFNQQKVPINYTFSDVKYHLRKMDEC